MQQEIDPWQPYYLPEKPQPFKWAKAIPKTWSGPLQARKTLPLTIQFSNRGKSFLSTFTKDLQTSS
jgi:hypothetical protein